MPKVISELLVGFGLDVDKQSFDSASAGITEVTGALGSLAAVAAGGLGLKGVLDNIGEVAVKYDDLIKKSRFINMNPTEMLALGKSYEFAGGTNDQAQNALEGIAADQRALKTTGVFPEWAAMTGTDLSAGSPLDVIDSLFKNLRKSTFSDDVKKQMVLDAGLGEAGFRVFQQGSIKDTVARDSRFVFGDAEGLGEKSENFNDSVTRLDSVLGKLTDGIADNLLPLLTDINTTAAAVVDPEALEAKNGVLAPFAKGALGSSPADIKAIESYQKGGLLGMLGASFYANPLVSMISGGVSGVANETSVGSAQEIKVNVTVTGDSVDSDRLKQKIEEGVSSAITGNLSNLSGMAKNRRSVTPPSYMTGQ